MNTKLELDELRKTLKKLRGRTIEVLTDYSPVTGVLLKVKFDYIVLKTDNRLTYIPLVSINSIKIMKEEM